MDINLIKDYFKKNTNKTLNMKKTLKFFENYPQIQKQCQQILIQHPAWQNVRNIIVGIVFDLKLKVCQYCRE